jgi:hypothetical protein
MQIDKILRFFFSEELKGDGSTDAARRCRPRTGACASIHLFPIFISRHY